MEKKKIVKLSIAAVVVLLAILFTGGVVGGGDMIYQLSGSSGVERAKLDPTTQDGTYSAESINSFSTVQVDMTIENTEITECVIASSGDSDLMTDEIRNAWAASIVEAQTAENDTITGATLVYSAGSVQEAVSSILGQATGQIEAPAEEESTPVEDAAVPEEPAAEEAESATEETEPAAEVSGLNDGTYSVEKTTDFSTIDVEITVEGGAVTKAAIASEGASDLLTDDHRNSWADQIVEKQAIDAVSGVTVSSKAVEEALAELLAQASGEANAEDVQSADASDRLSEILPYIAVSMGDNSKNSYVVDYLEQDPYLVNIYEGYGFAKDYGSARGHEYTLEDVAKTQRPHPKANCLTCKTPDLHKMIEEQGIAVYSMPFDDVMSQMTQNVACYTCHGADDGNGGVLQVTHQYVNEALGENVSTINPAVLACGQCHIEYYFTPENSETMMPYHSIDEMTPEAILAYYDAMDFADWTQESTGTRMLKVQHPEMETFLQGKHAAILSCADCHMAVEQTDGGVDYYSHLLVSPLESDTLLASCAKCHGEADMAALVHDIQDRVTARETEVGNKLSGLKDALAEATAAGEMSEDTLNTLRKLHREAQWYFDFCYVENAEGAHNSALAMACLDTSEAKIDEALTLLKQ